MLIQSLDDRRRDGDIEAPPLALAGPPRYF